MAGTPNNGSAFSKVADYVNYGTIALGLGINLGMGFPGLAGIYGMLKGSKKLFFTLKQMAVEGDFIKLLNQGNEPGIKYSIIGGNLYEFLEKGDNAEQWMNVVLKSGADLFYGKETDNDIAVATDSILAVSKNPNLTAERKACHHMNYFVEEEPLKVLHSWI